MTYWYRDKNGKLQYKTDNQIKIEGVIYIGIGLLIALLTVVFFKLVIGL